MRIVVLSDTHMPAFAPALPAFVLKDIESADMIIHAGDFTEIDILNDLEKKRPVNAVAGNMDSYQIKNVLKEKTVFQAGNFKIGLMHGWGPPDMLLDKMRVEFKDTDGLSCIIYGHTHIPGINIIDGIIYFNPGSPTDKTFAPYNAYGILDISDAKITPQIIKI